MSDTKQEKTEKQEQPSVEELKKKIEELKSRLEIYEGKSEVQQEENAEQEKKKVRKIFDMFDKDKSGDIDTHEFQELAYELGETLSPEETKKSIAEIDEDKDGKISFDEFYKWWTTKEESDKNEKMKVLKMKLKSKSYIRTVQRMGPKLSQSARIHTQELQKSRDLRGSQVVREDEIADIDLFVKVGDDPKDESSLVLKYYYQDEELGNSNRKEYGAKSNSIMASIALDLKEDADELAVGELSGNVKDMLTMVKDEIQYSRYTAERKTVKGKKCYVITLFWEAPEMVEPVSQILQGLDIRTFQSKISVNQTPAEKSHQGRPVQGTIKVDSKIPRDSVDFIKDLIITREESGSEDDSDSEASPLSGDDKIYDYLLSALQTLMNAKVALTFEDLTDFLQSIHKANRSIPVITGWDSLENFLVPLLKELLTDEECPPPILGLYYNILKTCNGLHSLTTQLFDYIIEGEATNLPLVKLLPSKEQLEQSGSESDTDDF